MEVAYSWSARLRNDRIQVAYLDRVLILPGEGINGPLLDTLLALGQALVPNRSLATSPIVF